MNYYNPTRIHFGNHREKLSNLLFSKRSALLHGEASMESFVERIKCNITCGGIAPNPTPSSIDVIYNSLSDVDCIIGLGGGSVLDTAKIVARLKKVPMIAIPTTSGTGSEVTPFATVWADKKYSIATPFPAHAIIDPELILSLPPYETAYTGFDALSHAMEAYWSKGANPVSDIYAKSAIRLIVRNLWYAVSINSSDTIEFRENMSHASLFAGLAISNAKTAAIHALSYPMTIHYGVPHGVACSLVLAGIWKQHIDSENERAFELTHTMGGSLDLYEYIRQLPGRIGLPTTLQAAGVTDIELILDDIDEQRLSNNPVKLTRNNLRGILQRIY